MLTHALTRQLLPLEKSNQRSRVSTASVRFSASGKTPASHIVASTRPAQTDDASLSAADRQAQLSYFSNRYASQRSVRRVSSLDEHYSKQAKASDETDRSRGGRTID